MPRWPVFFSTRHRSLVHVYLSVPLFHRAFFIGRLAASVISPVPTPAAVFEGLKFCCDPTKLTDCVMRDQMNYSVIQLFRDEMSDNKEMNAVNFALLERLGTRKNVRVIREFESGDVF